MTWLRDTFRHFEKSLFFINNFFRNTRRIPRYLLTHNSFVIDIYAIVYSVNNRGTLSAIKNLGLSSVSVIDSAPNSHLI